MSISGRRNCSAHHVSPSKCFGGEVENFMLDMAAAFLEDGDTCVQGKRLGHSSRWDIIYSSSHLPASTVASYFTRTLELDFTQG